MIASTVIREARLARITPGPIIMVGSLRRFAPDVGDVALLVVVPSGEHRYLPRAFERLPSVTKVNDEGAGRITATTERGPITIHVTAPEQAGSALVWHTGSRAHTEQLRRRADRLGLRLADGRVTRPDGMLLPCVTEEKLYTMLDLPNIAPELRSGDGELEAADRGGLPDLISEAHIRGDLHMHSTWSDGRHTIAEMASAAKQLGYQYIAISDHSERAEASHVLVASDVPKQRAEIDALRTRISGLELLHGVEVDIMPDGSLDFDDDLLEQFDLVLASLHTPAGDDAATLAERYLRAIRHPLVNVITHPANRAPTRFDGYDLDFDRLFAAAADSGTAMEIDGAPAHLDLDGALARRAVGAGVAIVVDSDAHRLEALGRQMRFGVGTARRGWLEPRYILNAQSVDDIRHFVARKRARG